jgi:hypothetical protein
MRVASSAAVVAAIVGSASAFVGPACLGSSSFAQRYFKLHLLQERTKHARFGVQCCALIDKGWSIVYYNGFFALYKLQRFIYLLCVVQIALLLSIMF